MSGLYLHIPFCRKACHYCNFHFSTSLSTKESMVAAICCELELVRRSDYLSSDPLETIYFGGGTPSLLSEEELGTILLKIRSLFSVDQDPEVTLEANPDDINPALLLSWRKLGINRLSIGVQSFFQEDLEFMNRTHSADQALRCLRDAKAAGFDNLSIDLIYGVPGMTDEKWAANVGMAIQEGVPHLSCYALTVEPSTALAVMIKTHRAPDVDPEVQATQFLYLTQRLEAAGYEHYEISNFSLPGKRSRHNTSYWQGKHYAGIGPSAHSFNGVSRQWNVANNALYMQSIKNGDIPFELETLTLVQQKNEYIMTTLRTSEGINLATVTTRFGEEETSRLRSGIESYVAGGRAEITSGHIRLTREGKLFADGIASDLFDED
jgi:oxygen-independent coproporphyrinogen-3 oxidase